MSAAHVNREFAALRAADRLGLEPAIIVAMPRIRRLPENNVCQGFADVKLITGRTCSACGDGAEAAD